MMSLHHTMQTLNFQVSEDMAFADMGFQMCLQFTSTVQLSQVKPPVKSLVCEGAAESTG